MEKRLSPRRFPALRAACSDLLAPGMKQHTTMSTLAGRSDRLERGASWSEYYVWKIQYRSGGLSASWTSTPGSSRCRKLSRYACWHLLAQGAANSIQSRFGPGYIL